MKKQHANTVTKPSFLSSTNTATHSDVPAVEFRETRSRLQFLSLTSSVEALSVLEVVRVECGKVAGKKLFHTGASKPLRLEEYDQTQLQATSHVRLLLEEHCFLGSQSSKITLAYFRKITVVIYM